MISKLPDKPFQLLSHELEFLGRSFPSDYITIMNIILLLSTNVAAFTAFVIFLLSGISLWFSLRWLRWPAAQPLRASLNMKVQWSLCFRCAWGANEGWCCHLVMYTVLQVYSRWLSCTTTDGKYISVPSLHNKVWTLHYVKGQSSIVNILANILAHTRAPSLMSLSASGSHFWCPSTKT